MKTTTTLGCIFLVVAQLIATIDASSCTFVSDLNTCTWIDYNTWFPGKDPKAADDAIGEKLAQMKNEACIASYVAYFCATTFPRCNLNGDGPLPVCRETCYNLLDHCPDQYHEGITQDICDSLPEVDCTSSAGTICPNMMTVIPCLAVSTAAVHYVLP